MRRVQTFTERGYKIAGRMVTISVINFMAFFVHIVALGTCTFLGGEIADGSGKYFVEEHGKVIELTAAQYWFSYFHGALTLALVLITLAVIGFLYWRGDLKDTYAD